MDILIATKQDRAMIITMSMKGTLWIVQNMAIYDWKAPSIQYEFVSELAKVMENDGLDVEIR